MLYVVRIITSSSLPYIIITDEIIMSSSVPPGLGFFVILRGVCTAAGAIIIIVNILIKDIYLINLFGHLFYFIFKKKKIQLMMIESTNNI